MTALPRGLEYGALVADRIPWNTPKAFWGPSNARNIHIPWQQDKPTGEKETVWADQRCQISDVGWDSQAWTYCEGERVGKKAEGAALNRG